jgi:ribosomal protein L34E
MHCPLSYLRRDKLLNHVRKKHPSAPKCLHCDSILLSTNDMRKHESCNISKTRLKCKLCGKYCNCILQHLKKMHPQAVEIGCPKCEAVVQVATLLSHHCFVDLFPAAISCEYCGLEVSYSERDDHLKVMLCGQCGTSWPCVATYMRHVCRPNNKELVSELPAMILCSEIS